MDDVDLGLEVEEQVTLSGGEGVGDCVHGFQKFVDCREEGLGTVGAGLDDRGVVGGAGRVEGVFVLLSVKFVGFQVDSKTGFIGESFQLSAFGFEEAELVSVPRGRVCEGDRFGFKGGDGIETG